MPLDRDSNPQTSVLPYLAAFLLILLIFVVAWYLAMSGQRLSLSSIALATLAH
jgi:hypothetical protein